MDKNPFFEMELRELVQGIKDIVEELKKLNSKLDSMDICRSD